MFNYAFIKVKGILGNDPKFNICSTGEVATFNVAVSNSFKKDGVYIDGTSWFDVVVFNDYLIKSSIKNLKKSSFVCLEGEMRDNVFKKNDEKVIKKQIIITKHFGDVMELIKFKKNDKFDEDIFN